MYKHFIWYRFDVMLAATGYVSPLQDSSNSTSESWCATPWFYPLEHVGKVDIFKCNFLHLRVLVSSIIGFVLIFHEVLFLMFIWLV